MDYSKQLADKTEMVVYGDRTELVVPLDLAEKIDKDREELRCLLLEVVSTPQLKGTDLGARICRKLWLD